MCALPRLLYALLSAALSPNSLAIARRCSRHRLMEYRQALPGFCYTATLLGDELPVLQGFTSRNAVCIYKSGLDAAGTLHLLQLSIRRDMEQRHILLQTPPSLPCLASEGAAQLSCPFQTPSLAALPPPAPPQTKPEQPWQGLTARYALHPLL